MISKKKPNSTLGTGRRSPKHVSDLLSNVLNSYALKAKAAAYTAFPYWKSIVGEQIAQVAKPEKISKAGTLQVKVIDAVWAQELSLQKTEILDKLHCFGQGAIIEDIKFTIGNPKDFKTK